VLLETHSTTRTAEKINRTQSSVSVALNKLRSHFKDSLFIRYGLTLTPTPFALQLQHPLRRNIFDVTRFVESGSGFDPASSTRTITLAIPDIAQSITAAIVNQLRANAPSISIQLANSSLEITDYTTGTKLLLDGQLDLLLSFYQSDAPKGIELIHLGSQSWSVIARQNHPISNQPTLEEWASYDHIQITSGEAGRTPVSDVLATAQVVRNVCLRLNGFLQALHTVAESDLLLTTMTPLVTPLTKRLALQELPLPFEMPNIPCCIMTRDTEQDPVSAWLINQILGECIKKPFNRIELAVMI